MNWMKPIPRFVGLLLLMLLPWLLLTACSQGESAPAPVVEATEETSPVPEETATPVPAALPYICPLDGSDMETMPVRAMAVTIDNYRPARPQSGLDKADLVYEVPVEGGITRYVAVFFHGQAETVGPVRSARPYLIDLAREWNSVYIHIGQSPQAQTYFKKTGVAHINQMYHSGGFWRDKSRKAPHNLYTSTAGLWREIVKLGLDKQTEPEPYLFRQEGETAAGSAAIELAIPYVYGRVGYRYDSQSGTYLRFLNDNPYQDLLTGAQLAAANVVVQQVPVRSFDSEGRLEVDLVGSGKAWLFSAGFVQEGTWRKMDLNHRTRFYDAAGSEMIMGPGQTWIQLVPRQTGITWE